MGYRFDFYDKIKETDPVVKRAFRNLRKVYEKMPETKGCMENMPECKAWCCKVQSPQFLYVEFLNIWKNIIAHSSMDEIYTYIEKSVFNYIKGDINKPCVFIDEKTGHCPIHESRGFSCRIYGIMDDEEFKQNKKRIEERYRDNPNMVIREQCGLVSCKKGSKPTKAQSDEWFRRLRKIESSIGVSELVINDGPNGSYRAPHDHILLKLFPPNIMSSLSHIRELKAFPKDIDLPEGVSYGNVEEFKIAQASLFLKGVKSWLAEVFSSAESKEA